MKTTTNIYDINGEIIRQAGDNHEFTLKEAQEKLQHYRKLREAEEESETPDKTKIAAYTTYINNLANYAAYKMSELTPEQLADMIGVNNLKQTSSEEINKALNDTETVTDTTDEVSGSDTTSGEDNTNEESRDDEIIGRELGDIHEKRSVSQSDLLVERDSVNTAMDEYVEFEEVA